MALPRQDMGQNSLRFRRTGKMYLLVVDAHTKWPEIINFNTNTKAYKLIEVFKELFSRFGFPYHCVTDGGPQFRSDEFRQFLARHGVKQSLSPPYHPATNGAAENLVQTFKDKVKKIVKGEESIEHCTTHRSPAYIMYKRELRTRFDLLRPNVSEIVEKNQKAQINARPGNRKVNFEPGDQIMIDDYGVRSERRIEGEVVSQTSPSTFMVVKDKNGVLQKRHVDQMLRRSPRLRRELN
ncbi:uncharacterized protein LOC105828425 [Monomorium pharaonis]|uniref:uncharacterized protein LOC105828425 n=1 Tax=Monomorium pharaonis TaxID=307658 RepID=UPI00174643F0|nr:uncharacterized protein LOC105828425 [Monomorium pharaonis]